MILPEAATAALRTHKAGQARSRLQLGGEYERHDLVFATTLGTPLDPANLYRAFKAVLQRANLGTWEREGNRSVFVAGFRLYDLRHSCATLLLLAGENPKVVSERLGHASVTLTLDTYSHVLPSMQEESARRLDAMFGASAEAS